MWYSPSCLSIGLDMIWQDSPSSLKPICELNEQGGDERALGLELLESSWPRASPTHIFPKTAPKLPPFIFLVPGSPLWPHALAFQIPNCCSKSSGVSHENPSCDIKNVIPSISITSTWWDLIWEKGQLEVISTPPCVLCLTCRHSLATCSALRVGREGRGKASNTHSPWKGPISWRTQR